MQQGLAAPTAFAIRKLQRNPDGTVSVVYIDASTGQPVQNLSGYQIADLNNEASLEDLGIDPVSEQNKEETEAEKVINHSRDGGENQGATHEAYNGVGRTESNNFGYFDKPTGTGLALGMLGGTFGTIVDKGINLNNAIAMEDARKVAGISNDSPFGFIKDAMMGTKDGRVGDVKIGDQQYSVGLEAQDKFGRTTLTPEEARERALITGQTPTAASKADVKSSIESFRATNKTGRNNTIAGALAGGVSDMVSGFNNFFSDIFGGGEKDWKGDSYYPDAPSGRNSGGGKPQTTKTTLSDFIGYTPDSDSGGGGKDPKSSNAQSNQDKSKETPTRNHENTQKDYQ